MKRIKHNRTEVNVYDKESDKVLLEMFKDTDILDDHTQCLQLRLNDNEVRDLIGYLSASIGDDYSKHVTK